MSGVTTGPGYGYTGYGKHLEPQIFMSMMGSQPHSGLMMEIERSGLARVNDNLSPQKKIDCNSQWSVEGVGSCTEYTRLVGRGAVKGKS